MFCNKCGNKLSDESLFCQKCGEKVILPKEKNVTYCNKCGTEIKEETKFCKGCGTMLIVCDSVGQTPVGSVLTATDKPIEPTIQQSPNTSNESVELIRYDERHCYSSVYPRDITGKVVALKLDCLREEFQKIEYQLVYVTSGKGALPGVFMGDISCITLYTDNVSVYDCRDIIGEVKPEFIPGWAKEKLENVYGISPETLTLPFDVSLSDLENERIDIVNKYMNSLKNIRMVTRIFMVVIWIIIPTIDFVRNDDIIALIITFIASAVLIIATYPIVTSDTRKEIKRISSFLNTNKFDVTEDMLNNKKAGTDIFYQRLDNINKTIERKRAELS